MTTPSLPQRALDRLGAVSFTARGLASGHIARTQTDFIGRMNHALADCEDIFDEFPNSDVIDRDQAERLDEALSDLAALALAQLAILHAQHPTLLQDAE